MKIYSFKNDYSENAHKRLLAKLYDVGQYQLEGYGMDTYCKAATELIKDRIKNLNADIHFVSGGTQANLIVISSILRDYESVIAANTGHIAVHETGAIEYTGHKINTIETNDGKLTPKHIASVLASHTDEHQVKPKLVFISNSTELGSIYSKNELKLLSDFCKEKQLFLYLDGARLASALTAKANDLHLSDICKYVDVFYIGGTKNGALLGEAIVINNDKLKTNFRYYLKQKGALLAKSWVIGIQFLEFFRDNLYFELGKHANLMSSKLANEIKNRGYNFFLEPVSNQIFPILNDSLIKKLNTKYEFYIWDKVDNDKSIIRLVTSWDTKEEYVNQFVKEF